MRHISKSAEPRELAEYRAKGGDAPSLNSFPGLDRLRQRLLADQGYLCCYCMGRVDETRMRIEHLRAQAEHPDARAEWANLLAACSGNEGRPPSEQHCDVRKGPRPLQLHPFCAEIAGLKYLADGSIRIDQRELQRDLDQVLNLNQRDLKTNRADALGALVRELTAARGGLHWPADTLVRKLASLRAAPRLRPYLGVLEYWLERQIRKRKR